jgi:hypothetical protein
VGIYQKESEEMRSGSSMQLISNQECVAIVIGIIGALLFWALIFYCNWDEMQSEEYKNHMAIHRRMKKKSCGEFCQGYKYSSLYISKPSTKQEPVEVEK